MLWGKEREGECALSLFSHKVRIVVASDSDRLSEMKRDTRFCA